MRPKRSRTSRWWQALSLLALSLSLFWPRPGKAEAVQKIALIVGNNLGIDGDLPLRFAESDAHKMAEVLRDLGDFSLIKLLRGQPAPAVLDTLGKTAALISSWKAQGKRVVFLFYFSGHGDGASLHLGGTLIQNQELMHKLVLLGADLRLAIIDACQSGAFVREKGLTPRDPTRVEVSVETEVKGEAILAATSRVESAQESDLLQGSFFSSYLVTGLRGAADRDGDGKVVLTEAFAYAADRTRQATVGSAVGIQHPTFDMKIRGKNDVALTWTRKSKAILVLKALTPGSFLVISASHGAVVAEVEAQPGQEKTLGLPADRYEVKKRATKGLYSTTLTLDQGSSVLVSEASLSFTPYRMIQPKGPPPLALTAEAPRPRKRTWTWVTGGAGLIALGLGGVLELLAAKDQREIDGLTSPGDGVIDYNAVRPLERSRDQYRLGGYVSLGLGGALSIASLVLFFTEGKPARASGDRQGVAFELSPEVGPASLGLSLLGRF